MEREEAKEICRKHMHRYVLIRMKDGNAYDGIVENVDEENVYLAVPLSAEENTYPVNSNMYPAMMNMEAMYPAMMNMEARPDGFGYPGFGYPGYGYPGFGYPGYGYFPRRRFRRLILPLALLAGLTLLPYY